MLSEWVGRSNAIAGSESEQVVYINYVVFYWWFSLQAYVGVIGV